MAKKATSPKKVKELENGADKKAAKAAAGKDTGASKAVASAKGNGAEKAAKVTIGSTAIALLKSGMSAKDTLAEVLKRFPDANTKMASIYWYANHEGIKLQKPAAPKVEKQQAAATA